MIIKIEKILRTLLLENGFINVYCNQFGSEIENGILIRRDGSFEINNYLPIENARVFILCREKHPEIAMERALEINNFLHKKEHFMIQNVSILGIFQNIGISPLVDDDTDLFQTFCYYEVKYLK